MGEDFTFVDLENLGMESLKHAGMHPSRHDVRLLLMQAAGIDKAGLISKSSDLCDASVIDTFSGYLKRRSRREPVYRILGQREFHGLNLQLNNATLEPRDDSESLIEITLEQISDRNAKLRFLDMGTGTGAVALALLKELPNAGAMGADVEPEAVQMSRTNALANGLGDRFVASQSDWFGNIESKFDFIVSNPPYIARAVIQRLEAEVRLHDPLIALDGGPDGLDAYRTILGNAAGYLRKGGFVSLEIGHDQKTAVSELANNNGWVQLEARRDISGRDRVMVFGP
jgi:release factor glutamine methyltransferase